MGGAVAAHQLFCFLEGALCLADGSFAWLAAQLGYLIKFLLQVCLHETELSGVAFEELGASVCVEGVGHDGRWFGGVAEQTTVGSERVRNDVLKI